MIDRKKFQSRLGCVKIHICSKVLVLQDRTLYLLKWTSPIYFFLFVTALDLDFNTSNYYPFRIKYVHIDCLNNYTLIVRPHWPFSPCPTYYLYILSAHTNPFIWMCVCVLSWRHSMYFVQHAFYKWIHSSIATRYKERK